MMSPIRTSSSVLLMKPVTELCKFLLLQNSYCKPLVQIPVTRVEGTQSFNAVQWNSKHKNNRQFQFYFQLQKIFNSEMQKKLHVNNSHLLLYSKTVLQTFRSVLQLPTLTIQYTAFLMQEFQHYYIIFLLMYHSLYIQSRKLNIRVAATLLYNYLTSTLIRNS